MDFNNKPEPANHYESEDLEHQREFDEIPDQSYEHLKYEAERQLTEEDQMSQSELERMQDALVPIESVEPDLETIIEVENAIKNKLAKR